MDPRPPDDESPQEPDPWAIPSPGEASQPSAPVPPSPVDDASLGTRSPTDDSPPRRGRTVIAMVVAAALVLGGGAAATAFLVMRGSSDQIVHMIPATTDVVTTAYLDPAASQKANLLMLARKFPALSEGGGVGGSLNEMIDDMFRETGLTHEDVLPWLGSQLSAITELDPDTLNPTMGLLIETNDEEAARRALETLTKDESLETHSYKGVETHTGEDGSWAIFDGVVVLVDDSTSITTIIDTSQGDTKAIADDPRFVSTLAALPEGKLGFVYINPARFIDLFATMSQSVGMDDSSAPGLDQLRAYRSIGISLSAERDGVAIDVTVRFDPSMLDAETKALLDAPANDNTTLSFIPADSYAVFSQENVDLSLRQAMDQMLAAAPPGEGIPERFGVDEALASLTGDVAVEVGPGTDGPVGAAVLLGVDETGPAQKTLDELAQTVVPLLQSASGPYGQVWTKHQIKKFVELGADPNDFVSPALTIRWRSTTYQGTTIKYLEHSDLAGSGFAPSYAVLDGAAVIATDPGEIRQLIDVQNGEAAITGVPRYVDAIGRVPTGGGAAFVDVEAAVSAIRDALPPAIQAAFDEDAGPNLAPVKVLVTGTENSSQGSTTRIFVVIQ